MNAFQTSGGYGGYGSGPYDDSMNPFGQGLAPENVTLGFLIAKPRRYA